MVSSRSVRPNRAPQVRDTLLFAACLMVAATAAAATQQSDRLVVAIDESTGALQRITDRRDDRVLADASLDAYALLPTPETRLNASESDDRVVARHGAVFVCENPKLPQIAIEKSYTVQQSRVTKHVRFRATAKDLGFLQYSTASHLPDDFYKPGYLNNPTRHVVNQALPYIPVSTIEKEIKVSDFNPRGDHRLVIFTNPMINRGLAQYRFKVDGHFVHPLSSYTYEPGLYFSPQGWRMAVAAKWLSSERDDLSCDVQWHVFDGDHLAFHAEYLDLPEWKAVWQTDVPAWMQEVKGIITWEYAKNTPTAFPEIKAAADSLSSGYLMVLVRGVFHNTRAYLADPIPTAHGQTLVKSQLQEWVRQLRALSPRIKVGPITWQWAFGELDPVFREHPEWTVHGADGQPAVIVGAAWEGEKASAQLLTPECRRFLVEQFTGMVKTYDFDFIYMDTGQGGITMLDWRSKQSAQDYDWALLYKGIRDAARSNGGGSFFNGIPNLFSLYSDFGYYEGYDPYREHWQARSDRLVLAKVYQRPIEKRAIPLYWDKHNWSTESYPKLCYALAIKPGGFDWRGEFDALRWPVIGSLLEIERAELVPAARWEPCWWRQSTDMEVYALRVDGAGLLTVYSHAATTQSVEASLDLAPFGFDPAKPVHVWRFDPKTLAALEAENPDRLTEAQASALFARTGRAPLRGVDAQFVGNVPYPKDGRLAQTLEVEGDRVAILMVTQAPTLAYAKDGQATHFLLPARGASGEQTVRADQPLASAVAASRQSVLGDRKPAAASTPKAASSGDGVPFQGDAVVRAFSGGAKLVGTSIDIPAGGAIEATGLAVTTLKVARPAGASPLQIWITYSRGVGEPLLYKHVLAEVDAGADKEVPFDLNLYAPKGWTGTARLEVKGEAGTVRIIFNSKFQLF